MLDAKKYTYRTQWSEEDKVYIARCLEFSSLSAHGDTHEEALKEIQTVVNESIEWMKSENETIPQPFGFKNFSGRYPLRISPELHRELAIRAAEQNVSLNQYIQIKLAG